MDLDTLCKYKNWPFRSLLRLDLVVNISLTLNGTLRRRPAAHVSSAAKCGEFSPKWGFLTVPKGGFLTVLFSKISENVGIFKNFGPSGDFHPKTFGSTGTDIKQ